MSVTRLPTGRPRPMSALEAMTGGPWLFASVALLGLGWAAAQVAMTRLLAVLYAPGLVVACLMTALGGLGLGAALVHGLSHRLEPTRLPVGGALAMGGALVLLAGLTPLASAGLPPALALGLTALPAAAAGFTLAASFAAVDRRTGRLLATWLAAVALGLPAGLGLLMLTAPPTALLGLAVLPLIAALAAALAARRGAWPVASLLGLTLGLAIAALALRWPSLAPERLGPAGQGLGAVLTRAAGTPRLDGTRWDGAGRRDVVVTADGQRQVFVDGLATGNAAMPDLAPLAPGPARGLTIQPPTAASPFPAAPAGWQAVTGDGRTWLRQYGTPYDLIWLGQPGALRLHPAGLAETGQFDLTVEAIDDYLRALAPTGLLVLRLPDEATLQRAALVALTALERREIPLAQATRHLLAIDRPQPLLVIRPLPWSADESAAIRGRLLAAGWRPLFLPHLQEDGPLRALASGQLLRQVARAYPALALAPATDNTPFFSLLERDLPPPVWLALVLTSLILLAILGYLTWAVEPGHPRVWRAVAYAAAVGAGGTLLPRALEQRFAVWLEGAELAVLVTLTVLGLWSALGAALSDQVPTGQVPRIGLAVGVCLAAWAALESFGLVLPVDRLAFLPPLIWRVVIVGLLLAPLGLALGVPLPLLLRAAQRHYAGRPVALLWAIHGAAAAVGGGAGLALALRAGLSANLLLAAALFAGMALLARPALAR